ncbi:FAR1-related sequence 5-like protein [Tanacetum coccineum]
MDYVFNIYLLLHPGIELAVTPVRICWKKQKIRKFRKFKSPYKPCRVDRSKPLPNVDNLLMDQACSFIAVAILTLQPFSIVLVEWLAGFCQLIRHFQLGRQTAVVDVVIVSDLCSGCLTYWLIYEFDRTQAVFPRIEGQICLEGSEVHMGFSYKQGAFQIEAFLSAIRNIRQLIAPQEALIGFIKGDRRIHDLDISKLFQVICCDKDRNYTNSTTNSLTQKATKETTIIQIHKDLIAHRNRVEALTKRLDHVHSDVDMRCFMDPSHSSLLSCVSQNYVSSHVVDESCVPSGSSLNALIEEIVAYEKESDETHAVKELDAFCTPESFVTHSNFDTLGGTVYYIPKVYADVLLVKENVYDSVDDCVVAYMKYAAEAEKFVLNAFDTIHNHELEREELKHLSKRERQLTYLDQAFIVKAASVNIGATIAHHLLTGDSDAHMLIHKMENRKKHVSDFSFDYFVENAELSAIFWADEVSKYKYREFGDVVSFDTTFNTNKVFYAFLYKMVFVPFIAIDNHRKCVTVAAGLLKNETTKSYIWLLKAFIKAFGKAPSIVVTDQDGAIRNAIEAEFAGSKHRLCMWHITQKLHAKICAKIYDETDFKEKLNKIVWNMYIGLEEFEYRWGKLMEEFKLETSRSESENSFFSHFINSGLTLMNFMNCFETAMEKQRHVQERMDHKTIDTVPKLKTFLKIKRHASNVYTRSLFELVQKEIFVGLWHCQIDSKSLVEGSEECIIKESPYIYEMSKKKKNPQYVDKGKEKAKEDDTVDLC